MDKKSKLIAIGQRLKELTAQWIESEYRTGMTSEQVFESLHDFCKEKIKTCHKSDLEIFVLLNSLTTQLEINVAYGQQLVVFYDRMNWNVATVWPEISQGQHESYEAGNA